ncbi:MAG: hypothetical protein PUD51_01870, partial [Prevotellaceae bacterium]|nr:hypothetical protein [Prevotellaceae bacterium]
GNPEMEYIMRRLASAAADPDVRQDMNVEDEYFSALEARDTTLMILNQKIEEKDAQLEQKAAQLEQKAAQLEQKDAQLEQKDAQLEQKDAQLEQKDAQLEQNRAELEQKDKALTATVKALKDAGMAPAQIALITGLDVGYIDTI